MPVEESANMLIMAAAYLKRRPQDAPDSCRPTTGS